MSREVMRQALIDLVNQIRKCNPVDDHGHSMLMNMAFIKAVKVLDAELAKPDEPDYKHLLGELLARIHRDGGHYVIEHGWYKAVQDADEKVVSWIHKTDDKTQPVAYRYKFESAYGGFVWLWDTPRWQQQDPVEVMPVFAAPPPPAEQGEELSDEEINGLRQQYGVTSNGRGIKEFTQVCDFARVVIAADRKARGGSQ